MEPIIGRKEEKEILEAAFYSDTAEFISLYGRRRVGKTYLVRNTLGDKEDTIFFYVSGRKDGSFEDQVSHFTKEIARAFGLPKSALEVKKNWEDTFDLLTEFINQSSAKKIVLFFDEFPWMVTRKSMLLQAVDLYWNRFWSMDKRVKLIICGSASAWILKHIVNAIGGLYNRSTHTINLKPFKLHEVKEYLEFKNIRFTKREMVHIYMVLGGIPFYLNQLKAGLSSMQNVEWLAFKKGSFLIKEFTNLYDTLFGSESDHLKIIRTIAEHCEGIGQEELSKATGIPSGGTLLVNLIELEEAGFIQRFKPFGHIKRGIFYKMADEYSLFYFKWIEPNMEYIERGEEKGFWVKLQNSPSWHSWAGCAFEAVCNKHVPLIREALHLSMARASQWRYVPEKGSSEKGAQIDLLFDRDDDAITICEIKYTKEPYTITKSYAENIKNKLAVFKKHTDTKKTLYFAMISASGLQKNRYSGELVSGLVTLDDIFREYSW